MGSTIDLYSHVIPDMQDELADAVADVVNGYVAEVNGEAALAKMRGE